MKSNLCLVAAVIVAAAYATSAETIIAPSPRPAGRPDLDCLWQTRCQM